MTHPTREEWMTLLYDEAAPETKSALQVHLEVCAECRAEFEGWQRAGRRLDDWRLPKRRAKHRLAAPVLKWGLAASLAVCAGLGGFRLWALNNEVSQLRTEMQGAFKREVESTVRLKLAEKMERELDAAFASLVDQSTQARGSELQSLWAALAKNDDDKRLEDQRTLVTALQQLQTKHAEDYASLRKELETVAVLTEAGLQRAQNEIANIAYAPKTFSDNK